MAVSIFVLPEKADCSKSPRLAGGNAVVHSDRQEE